MHRPGSHPQSPSAHAGEVAPAVCRYFAPVLKMGGAGDPPAPVGDPPSMCLARIFHSRWVARATCPCRRATSPAEARRQTPRVASPRHDKVLVHAWSASCRPEQAGSLFHPFEGKQYEIFGLSTPTTWNMHRAEVLSKRLSTAPEVRHEV